VAAKANKKIFIVADEGVPLTVLEIGHKTSPESFGGALVIIERGLPPGGITTPHTHSREDECSFVLRCGPTCYVGGEIGVASVGSYVVESRVCLTPYATRAPIPSGSRRLTRWASSRTSTASIRKLRRAR